MLQVFGLVAPLFSMIILGFIAGKLAKLPLAGLAWLNVFIIYLALPALFFQLLSRLDLAEFVSPKFLFITTYTTFLIFILSFGIAMWRSKGNIGSSTIQGFAGAYGNVGYMGPPLALAAFGAPAIAPAAMIFSFDNTLHFILAPLLMGLRKGKKQHPLRLIGKILFGIFTHPFILATIAGLTAAAFHFIPPAPIDKALSLLSGAAAPAALFTMGVTAALRPLKTIPLELTWLVPIKLLLHPLLVYTLLIWLGPFDEVYIQTAVLLASLPAATNVFVLAQQYNVWQERASSAVVVSTLLAMVSVTMVIYFLR
ncbi:MAG TPA: AEC family transporter [Rhizobiales bacterium]|nr:AEC family transporter [Hyphomicrobiales bacterium]